MVVQYTQYKSIIYSKVSELSDWMVAGYMLLMVISLQGTQDKAHKAINFSCLSCSHSDLLEGQDDLD